MNAGVIPSTLLAKGGTRGRGSDERDNCGSDLFRVVMLPETRYSPAGFAETCSGFDISRNCSRQLRSPVPLVRLDFVPVLRARVPEAAIDEHRDPMPREHNVGRAPIGGNRPYCHPVPKARGMQTPPHGEFRAGVARADCLHVPAAPGRRRRCTLGRHISIMAAARRGHAAGRGSMSAGADYSRFEER